MPTKWITLLCPNCRKAHRSQMEGLTIHVRCPHCEIERDLSATDPLYRGVSWHKGDRRWRVKIKAYGKHHYLGNYADPEEAARVYDLAAKRLHGPNAVMNFPDDSPSLAVEQAVNAHLADFQGQ